MARALVFEARERILSAEFASEGQNVLAVAQAGICASDRHVFHGRLGELGPLVLGHEVVGTIERLARPEALQGDPVAPGDRVGLVPGINCNSCRNCLQRRQYCQHRFVYGFTRHDQGPRLNGAFADLIDLRPGSKVLKVPASVSDDQAVFVELMACTVGAVEKAVQIMDPTKVQRALVLGAGPAGICAYAAAEWYGLPVELADVASAPLELARSTGIERLRLLAEGERADEADVVIDCAGTAASFQAAVELARPGGVVVEFGGFAAGKPLANFSFWEICQKELTVRGLSETLDRNFAMALRIVERTPYRLERLILQRFALADHAGIVGFLAEPVPGKGVIRP